MPPFGHSTCLLAVPVLGVVTMLSFVSSRVFLVFSMLESGL